MRLFIVQAVAPLLDGVGFRGSKRLGPPRLATVCKYLKVECGGLLGNAGAG